MTELNNQSARFGDLVAKLHKATDYLKHALAVIERFDVLLRAIDTFLHYKQVDVLLRDLDALDRDNEAHFVELIGPHFPTSRRLLRLFPRDQRALQEEAHARGIAPEKLLAEVWLFARWAAYRACRTQHVPRNAAGAIDFAGVRARLDRLTCRYVRRVIGSNGKRAQASVRLEDVPPAELAAPSPTPRCEAAAQLDALMRAATPGERMFLEAWRREPDARIAEIARRLGLNPGAGRVLVHRLRRRAAGM